MILSVIGRLTAIAIWVAPYWFGPTHLCALCGDEIAKDRAIRGGLFLWFCCQDHADEHWSSAQI